MQVEVCCKDISTCRSDSTASAAFNSTTGSSNNLHDNRPRLLLHLAASLLQLRGSKPSTSPLEDTQGNTLCFNGEVFGGLAVPAGGNDGKCLAAALGACATAEEVVGVLSSLRGPWSVIFWQHERQLLWFGRDWMGERINLSCGVPAAVGNRITCGLTFICDNVIYLVMLAVEQQHPARHALYLCV